MMGAALGAARTVVRHVLAILGFVDIEAERYAGCFHDIARAYGEALRSRVQAAMPGAGAAPSWLSAADGAALLADLDGALQRLNSPEADAKPVFSAMAAVEARFFHAQSDPGKLSFAESVRERFARVATPVAAQARAVASVPQLAAPFTAAMEADTVALLNYVHARYVMNIARETVVARQRAVLLLRVRRVALAYFLTLGVVWVLRTSLAHSVDVRPDLAWRTGAVVASLFALGYLGSIVSVAQRLGDAVEANILKGDPVFVIGGLAIGQRAMDVGMLLGGLFAFILYWIFAGGLGQQIGLSGGVFPVLAGGGCTRSSAADGFALAVGFCGQADLFRMFLFAFVAGYAERLVPDVLDAISKREA